MSIPRSARLANTLNAGWYCHQGLYQLERRAIFSKSWLLTTHQSRLPLPGDYVRYTIAGYPFFLIRDSHGAINAFFNVCRHRAFPLVQKDSGRLNSLICKFHGWTFDQQGTLVKAPQFDQLESFQKCEHALFRLHSTIDKRGLVYVNFSATQLPAKSWNEQFHEPDTQARLQRFDMDKYRYHHSWASRCSFNWKTLGDNFNECYHCPIAHPSIAPHINLERYKLKTDRGAIEHHPGIAGAEDDTAITYLFPNTAITMTHPFFYLMRVSPIDATTVSLEYEVFRHQEASDEDFEGYDSFFKTIEREDQDLCAQTQSNLNAGVFVAGPLHEQHEEGVLHFNNLVRSAVLEHHRQETEQGCKIEPARRKGGAHVALQAEEQLLIDLGLL